MFTLLLSGCEPSITGIRISKYPDSIVYIAGESTELDLCSGEIEIMRGKKEENIVKETMCYYYLHIESDIDFNTPGVYEVVIYVNYKNPINVKFAVQVIDEDFFENAKP